MSWCWFCTAALIGLGACGVDYPDMPVFTSERISCAGISGFGNGLLCSGEDGSVDVSLCGVEGAACTPGRLCVDTPQALSCLCTLDQDCSGYINYVNTARESQGQEELEPRCEGGVCVGDLDGELGSDLFGNREVETSG